MSIERVLADCYDVAIEPASVDLVIADPPYGQIVDERWDVANYERLAEWIARVLKPGGTAYVWGGIGKPQHRPFFRWLAEVESATPLMVWDLITWRKRRGYGRPDRLLFVREECAMLVKGTKPKAFHVPYLEKLRGYPGFHKKYPAKDARLRRTNVWDDVTEILRGKIHETEKPPRLAEIMIEMSSEPGDLVVDPMAGSGSTGVAADRLGRRCLLIEKRACRNHQETRGDETAASVPAR